MFFSMVITPLLNSERKLLIQHQFRENVEKCRKKSTIPKYMVRSILLQVTRGRQTARRGVLHLTLRRPPYHTINFPKLYQSKKSR